MALTTEAEATDKSPVAAPFVAPGLPGSVVEVKPRYGNFIGGAWIAPVEGKYMANISPVNGKSFCEVAKSTSADVELALDAAHRAKDGWGESSLTERAAVLNRIADAIEANLEMLAVAESWENGKPVRETLAADIPLAVDHFRYFAGAPRSLECRSTEIDKDTVAYHFHEPLGVVGQIIPFNFPLLMAAWKIAPALAAGNCTVLKPASPTPWSILKLAEVVADVVPPGVINIVTGPGGEIGKALATSPRIAKIRQGNPLDPTTMIGPQVSAQQLEKITSYVDIGQQEGAECLIGGKRAELGGEFEGGYYFEPTVLKGHNKMRVFQEEIFGPVLAVTTFADEEEALAIANDTLYGLGAGVWTRNGNLAYRMGRGIKAGRVWTNCFHLYPAGAAFGGYKISGVGRENHQMMLEHYSQTKNLLVSYSTKPLGFF